MSLDPYFDVGNYHKEVSTSSIKAQVWVNRALSHLWGFNQFEAIRCFKFAIEEDTNCAFAYYGVSYSHGPHYNFMKLPKYDYDQAVEYLQLAKKYSCYASDWEKDLINVLYLRYKPSMCDTKDDELSVQLKDFSDSMKAVYEKYPTDLAITALYAESLLNLRPWKLWNKNGELYPEAVKAREVLEKGLKIDYHPQLAHLYIHALELSPYFKDALDIANQMVERTIGIPHLFHMPSHIFIHYGDYKKCLETNLKAVEADKKIYKFIGEDNFYTVYRCHDIHFIVWTAMFIGDFDLAYEYSLKINEILHEGLIKKYGDEMEYYRDVFIHVLIRFGKWDEILKLPIIGNEVFKLYPITLRYARAISYAIKGEVDLSEKELNLFREEREKVPNWYRYGNNKPLSVYQVAEEMILGELLYRKGEYSQGFNHLRNSVDLYDNLVYSQHWDWMQPTRHALGALLLEQKHFKESEEVYLKDLSMYPNNIWSLVGLEEIYTLTKDEVKREEVTKALNKAKENTKNEIKVSCFCKKLLRFD